MHFLGWSAHPLDRPDPPATARQVRKLHKKALDTHKSALDHFRRTGLGAHGNPKSLSEIKSWSLQEAKHTWLEHQELAARLDVASIELGTNIIRPSARETSPLGDVERLLGSRPVVVPGSSDEGLRAAISYDRAAGALTLVQMFGGQKDPAADCMQIDNIAAGFETLTFEQTSLLIRALLISAEARRSDGLPTLDFDRQAALDALDDAYHSLAVDHFDDFDVDDMQGDARFDPEIDALLVTVRRNEVQLAVYEMSKLPEQQRGVFSWTPDCELRKHEHVPPLSPFDYLDWAAVTGRSMGLHKTNKDGVDHFDRLMRAESDFATSRDNLVATSRLNLLVGDIVRAERGANFNAKSLGLGPEFG